MSTDPSLLWTANPPIPRQAQPGELLFEFVRGHERWRCELRGHGEWGVEAQFLRNEELNHSYRLPTRALAVAWAEQERKQLERNTSG